MRITGNPTIDRVLMSGAGRRFPSQYSDNFARADGALGGRWQGSTWAIASGHAVGTPTLEGEKFADPGLEANYAAGLCSSLAKPAGGTVAQSNNVHGGSKAQQITATANGDRLVATPSSIAVGDWFLLSVWAIRTDGSSGNASAALSSAAGWAFTSSSLPFSDASYAQKIATSCVSSTAPTARVFNQSGTSFDTVIIDDISMRRIVFPTMLAGIRLARPNMDVSAASYRIAGTQFGVFSCLDSLTNPQNGVFCYLDGAGAVKVDELVTGTWVNKLSAAVTYVAGTKPRLKQTGLTTFVPYYGATQLGTISTISDVSVINNTICGLMTTYNGNYATSFDAVPAS